MNFMKASRVEFGKNITFRGKPESYIDTNRHGCEIEVMGSLIWIIDKKDKKIVTVVPMGNISYLIPSFKAGQLDAHIEEQSGPIVTAVVETETECAPVEATKESPVRRGNKKSVA